MPRNTSDRTRDTLLALLAGPDPDAAIHAALALAIGGDDAGAELLREQIRKRDPYVPATSRNHNYPRLEAEAYLLGGSAHPPMRSCCSNSPANGWPTTRPSPKRGAGC